MLKLNGLIFIDVLVSEISDKVRYLLFFGACIVPISILNWDNPKIESFMIKRPTPGWRSLLPFCRQYFTASFQRHSSLLPSVEQRDAKEKQRVEASAC